MTDKARDELRPYRDTRPGFESVYIGAKVLPATASRDSHLQYAQDGQDNVYLSYSSWGVSNLTEEDWNNEINHINLLQQRLGHIDDSTRLVRAQIASLQSCDNGVPVTIDEILRAIGRNELQQPAFHAGCWLSMSTQSTQPGQTECMQTIETVLQSYRDRGSLESLIEVFPMAEGFIRRTYDWLGPVENFTALQQLMLERVLLPFDFFTKRTEDYRVVDQNCFGPGGRGAEIDQQISEVAGLPEIFPNYKPEFHQNMKTIDDPQKRAIYGACCAIAHGLHGLSDCHHSTFRWIESWIYSIGKYSLQVATRDAGVEATRLGRLLFGYALGLDRWLQGVPMQWLLLDLGHIELGSDPKNEILRVYANLGERNPVKEWLAACLWFTLVLERPASLYDWGYRHRELVAKAQDQGISVREWMDMQLQHHA